MNMYMGLSELCRLASRFEAEGAARSAFCEAGHAGPLTPMPRGAANRRRGGACCAAAPQLHLRAGPSTRNLRAVDPPTDYYFRTVDGALADAAKAGGLLLPNQLLARFGEQCIAWQLVQAYFAFREVACLGPTSMHFFWDEKSAPGAAGAGAGATTRGRWSVLKRNRQSRETPRVVCLDEDEHGEFMFSTRNKYMDLHRRIPVTYIVLVEKMLSYPRRLILHMETGIASGADRGKPRDEDGRKTLAADTVYDLTFATHDDRRAFLRMLVDLRALMVRKHEAEDADLGRFGSAPGEQGGDGLFTRGSSASSLGPSPRAASSRRLPVR